ncbi:MAG: hypothetical protein NTW79_02565 [Candidatus Berkelbacteria bacterium]|nr:hypothetical protein [Candidatus Berkelbacteria bacterium]
MNTIPVVTDLDEMLEEFRNKWRPNVPPLVEATRIVGSHFELNLDDLKKSIGNNLLVGVNANWQDKDTDRESIARLCGILPGLVLVLPGSIESANNGLGFLRRLPENKYHGLYKVETLWPGAVPQIRIEQWNTSLSVEECEAIVYEDWIDGGASYRIMEDEFSLLSRWLEKWFSEPN